MSTCKAEIPGLPSPNTATETRQIECSLYGEISATHRQQAETSYRISQRARMLDIPHRLLICSAKLHRSCFVLVVHCVEYYTGT
ncbi:hypothetical protein BGZ63DRAFT_386135 [Mariannaea sp. PMI_226]|nr:hypothetical protein BGZ63DRAFT_386135 [Mariannaea sp. PMI_226]